MLKMNKPSIQTRLVVDNERLSITMEYFNRFPIFRAGKGEKCQWYPAGKEERAVEVICYQFRKLLRVLLKYSGLHAHYKYQRRIIDALTELTRILSSVSFSF
ncbi:hypothetical protein T01_1717 [Trichinella spiralis]|uniref:Uncharacterized protein n=1 Tax=Trichinella spiralis TaxID=6334 RepID=A0A0V1BTN1_TRISP|nr:hypothetical protein T01_1717 [Trichinella spiralis]